VRGREGRGGERKGEEGGEGERKRRGWKEREGKGGSSSFVLGKKEKSAPMLL